VSLTISIDVETSTPASIGWYEPSKQDPVGLRASEVKGLWRWWSRVCIAGAMYDLGILKGTPGENVLLKPSSTEIETIDCFVGKILGLGYVGGAGSEASRYVIYIKEHSIKIINLEELRNQEEEKRLLQELASYQRFKLLTRGRKEGGRSVREQGIGSFLDKGSRFTLIIRKRTSSYPDAERLAIKILYLALQLTGIGKGARRGLGSLDIVGTLPVEDFKYKSIGELLEDVYSDCLSVVEKYKNLCIGDQSFSQRADIPPMPVLSKSKYRDSINVTQIYLAEGIDFRTVHNFFLRSERCRILYGKPICQDPLRRNYFAWILGLPRGQLPKKQPPTGYLITVPNVSRRASPILISYHAESNILGPGTYVSTFLSGDWPKTLKWHGKNATKYITVNTQMIVGAYRTTIDELSSYLKALRTSLRLVWP